MIALCAGNRSALCTLCIKADFKVLRSCFVDRSLGHSSIDTARIYIMTVGGEDQRKIDRFDLIV